MSNDSVLLKKNQEDVGLPLRVFGLLYFANADRTTTTRCEIDFEL